MEETETTKPVEGEALPPVEVAEDGKEEASTGSARTDGAGADGEPSDDLLDGDTDRIEEFGCSARRRPGWSSSWPTSASNRHPSRKRSRCAARQGRSAIPEA